MKELKDKYVGRFVGPDKIADIAIADITTPAGSAVFEITFGTGITELLPEKGLALTISDEPKDFNHIRDVRVNAMIPQIVDLILEYDLPTEQWIYFLGLVGDQLRNRIYRAQSFLIHGDDSRYIPGSDPENEMTLLHAERIIAKIPKREKTEETPATDA